MQYNRVNGLNPGAIVCIHGLSSSAKVFGDFLSQKDFPYTRIAIELPGHGVLIKNSSESGYALSSQTKRLINLLNDQIDEDILLLGNSFGGHLAIEAAQHIKRLKGLVICGTPPLAYPANFEEAFLPVAALNTFLTKNPTDKDIKIACDATLYNKKLLPQVIKDFKDADPNVRSALAATLNNGDFADQAKIFKSLKVPKYIFRGDQDPSVNPKYLENIANNCRHSCEIINFEKCGHYPSLDRPKLFVESLTRISENLFSR